MNHTYLGILGGFWGDFWGILGEFLGNYSGILREFFGEFFGNYLGIFRGIFREFFGNFGVKGSSKEAKFSILRIASASSFHLKRQKLKVQIVF